MRRDDLELAKDVGNAAVAMAIAVTRAHHAPALTNLHLAQAVEVARAMATNGQWYLSAEARSQLVTALDALAPTAQPYARYLRQWIERAGSPPHGAVGQTRVLFAAESNLAAPLAEPFAEWAPAGRVGAQQRLQVEWEPYGSMTTLVHGANRDSRTRLQLDRAFRVAVRVATRQVGVLAREHDPRWQSTFHYYQQVALKSVEGRFPDVSTPVHGDSLTLGAVLAVLSAFLGVGVPGETAFTGALDDAAQRARLSPVGGMREKVAAALTAGVPRVIAPATEDGQTETRVDRFASVEAVIDALWPRGTARLELADRAYAFVRQHVPAGVRSFVPQPVQPSSEAAHRRVLISWVTPQDPWCAVVPRRGDGVRSDAVTVSDWQQGHGWAQWPGERWDGIVLSVMRHVQPTDLLLMVIDGPGRDGGPSTRARAHALVSMIREKWPETAITLFDDIKADGTVNDYHAMLNAIPDDVRKAVDNSDPDTEVILNATGGTDAMTHAMLLLPVLLRTAGTRLVQSIGPNNAREGSGRARFMPLPALA